MGKTILYFLVLVGLSFSSQGSDPDPTAFVDEISVGYKIRFIHESADELDLSDDAKADLISKCKKYIPAAELKSILKKETAPYKWDQSKLKTTVCISSPQDPRLKINGDRLFYVSLPRYDKTGNYAIVKIFQRIIYDNPDISYGNIDVYLFRLKDKKWKEVVNHSLTI